MLWAPSYYSAITWILPFLLSKIKVGLKNDSRFRFREVFVSSKNRRMSPTARLDGF